MNVTKKTGTKGKALWVCSAPNVFRHTPTGMYYVFTMRGKKRYRRSLKTTDFEMAKRKAAEFLSSVGNLKNDDDANLPFAHIGQKWLAWHQHSLSDG